MSPSMYVVKARTGEYAYAAQARDPRRPEEPTGQEGTRTTSTSAFPRQTEKYGG